MSERRLYLLSSSFHRQVEQDGEQALLQASLQWLSQSPERSVHARQLFSHIRFPLIPIGELVERVLPAMRALLPGEAGCEALVEEAVAYHSRPSAQPLLQTQRTALREGVERLLLIGGEVREHGRTSMSTIVDSKMNQHGKSPKGHGQFSLFANLRCPNMEKSSAPMFAVWKGKREAGKWKRSCQLSGATTAWRCWGASSSPQGAVHQGTTVEALPVTCCTDTTPAIIGGAG